MRIELYYRIVSLGLWNVANLTKKGGSQRTEFLLSEDQDHDRHLNEKIHEELACFLFTTQTSLFSNSHCNLVPRAHVPFGQHRDTELWNNQFQETKILGLSASRRMRGLVYMASREKVDVDTFHKGIQYALERLGQMKLGFESKTVSNFKSKSHEGSGNELVDYSRGPCLGAD